MKEFILKMIKNLAHPGTIIGLIVSIAVPFLVYLGPNVGHKDTIKQLDLSLPFPLFCVQFIAIIALFCILNKDFREWIKGILPEKAFSILAIVFAVAIAIFAGTQIEARHRVQSDESVFMSVAQNIYYNQESGTCNQGYYKDGGLECVSKSNSFKTKGLSFLYVLGMPLFGTDLHWIFKAELLMLPLTFLLMFLAIVAWTKQPLLAFFAALLTALQPTVLFQFRSMSVEPLYIFLSALSLLTFRWAYDRNTVKYWALAALILAFFAQTRQETVFCFIPFILFALPKLLDSKSAKTPTFFVLLSVFSVPVLLTISAFQGFGFQGGEFEAHGHFIEDLTKNWEIMTKPLKNNGELSNPFLTYFNYLFAFGGIYLIFRAIYDALKGRNPETKFFYLKVLAFLALYHLQTYVILENVSGDFSIEINQRYSLVMIPSMAFLAALPVAHIAGYLSNNFSNKNKPSAASAILVATLIALIFAGWTAHYKNDFNKNIMYNRNHLTVEEYEILSWLSEQPQKERLFIYGRPWHFVGYGVSSIHYDKARQMKSGALQKLIDQYDGEVYYIRGLDCWDSQTYHKKAVEHRIATTCDVFEREMDLEGVKNILVTNNYWVQIAKFNGRKNYNTANIIAVKQPSFVAEKRSEKNLNEVDENTDVNKIETDSLQINFVLKETSSVASLWDVNIALNDKPLMSMPYAAGDQKFMIPGDTIQPGFNQIQYTITNRETKKKVAVATQNYFNAANGVVALNSMKPSSHTQGWGTLHTNASIDGNSLTINGKKFEQGFGTHAASETEFDLDKKFSLFRTSVGLDDESLCSEGVSVEIYGDDKLLANTPSFKNGEIFTLTARTEGVQKLKIKTIPTGGIDCTHVDIVNSALIP